MEGKCPDVSTLRDWANTPASSGTVPIYPSTVRAIADHIELLEGALANYEPPGRGRAWGVGQSGSRSEKQP